MIMKEGGVYHGWPRPLIFKVTESYKTGWFTAKAFDLKKGVIDVNGTILTKRQYKTISIDESYWDKAMKLLLFFEVSSKSLRLTLGKDFRKTYRYRKVRKAYKDGLNEIYQKLMVL